MLIICCTLASNFSSYCQKQTVDTSNESLIMLYKLASQEFIGEKVVEFSAFDLYGNRFTTNDLNDKITFINFWFEACPPCLAEFEALNNLYEKYKCKEKFQFFSFTFETKEDAERVVKQHNLKFPVLLISYDSSKIMNFGQGFPLNMILNKEGKVNLISPGGPIAPKEAQEKFNILFKPSLDSLLQ